MHRSISHLEENLFRVTYLGNSFESNIVIVLNLIKTKMAAVMYATYKQSYVVVADCHECTHRSMYLENKQFCCTVLR